MIPVKIRIDNKTYTYECLQDLFDGHVIEDKKGRPIRTYSALYKQVKKGKKFKNCRILELRQPLVSGECEHPYHSVLGDGEMQPAKCLKCGKVL